jgi:hypothetical protein
MRRRSDPNASRIAVEVSFSEAERSAGTASRNSVPRSAAHRTHVKREPSRLAFAM